MPPKRVVAMDVDSLTRKEVEVGELIPSAKEFNLYSQLLGDVLVQDTSALASVQKQLDKDRQLMEALK